MTSQPALTSPGGSSNRNPPERCPRPLYSRDSTQEDQVQGLVVVKFEEEEDLYVMSDGSQKGEDIPSEISTDSGNTRELLSNIKVEKEEDPVRIKEEDIFKEISTGGCCKRNLPERCPHPLYSQDPTQEHQEILQESQGNHLVKVEVKEEPEDLYVMGKEEEIPTEIGTDGRYRRYSTWPDVSPAEEDVTDNSSDDNPMTPKLHQPLPSADPSAPNRFPCSECKKSFTRKENLLSHQRIHRGEDPLSCPECGKCFIWKRQLVIHQRSHTGEKPLSCTECGKSFSERSNLIRHQKSHSTERPFACSQCSKCFPDRTKLNNHQRTHTGEKPHSCAECGERFSRKSSLTRHEKFHRGEKPYSCTECGKCFTERANLVTHYRIHTGDRPYSCSKCGRAFKQRSDLVRHEKVHLRYQWHFCSECGQQFALKASLIAHLSTHSRPEVPVLGNGS